MFEGLLGDAITTLCRRMFLGEFQEVTDSYLDVLRNLRFSHFVKQPELRTDVLDSICSPCSC